MCQPKDGDTESSAWRAEVASCTLTWRQIRAHHVKQFLEAFPRHSHTSFEGVDPRFRLEQFIEIVRGPRNFPAFLLVRHVPRMENPTRSDLMHDAIATQNRLDC
eukprot:scaffold1133_cov367-Pavlova_lutheri.AAC.1